ncbi:MAG: tetratricopeptide repeat protein [Saprospiraceae bacterium]
MVWNKTLTDIQYRLVELYPDDLDIKRICITSGINVSTVQLQGAAINQWFSILSSIEIEKINEIAAIVERDRGQKDDRLETLINFLTPKEKVVIALPENKLHIQRRDFPRPKTYFVGREQELEDINKAYESNPFILIEGAGGIGKTQFVAKFIETLPHKDRIVWFDCLPTSQPDDVILGAGFDELLKGKEKTEREKFSAFKDKVQEFELVVFLDNYQEVENDANFKSLLAFFNDYLTKGHLIVIGRDDIVSPDLQPSRIHLKGLGDKSIEHARKLIEHVYAESKDISNETLVRVCHELKGYPLAIDLAVYLLSEGESADTILQAAVAQAMSEESGKEKISERLLNTIFTRTDASQEEKEFLKLISVFRGRVEKAAAQYVMPSEYYQTAWKKLIKRNLLTVEDDYFELHPLIREFSYKALENKQEVHTRAANYFSPKRTENLDIDLEEKLFYHFSQANQWSEIAKTITNSGSQFILGGYLDRLQNMITLTRKLGESQPFFDILEGDIAEIKGDWVQATLLFENAIKNANDDVRIEGIIKSGEMYYRKSQLQEAKNLFEVGIQESEKDGLSALQARALNDMGLVYSFWGEKQLCLDYLNKALSIRENVGSLGDIATSLNNIGGAKSDLGEKKEALNHYERSLDIQEEIGDKSGISTSLNNIGLVKSDLGENEEALKLFERSLDIKEEIGDKSGISISLNNIGLVKSKLGEKKEALKFFERSLKIQEEIGHKSGIANSLHNIGHVKSKLGEKKEALKFYERSLKIQEEIGHKSGIATSLNNIGGVKSDLGEKKEALRLYERSLAILEEIGHKSGIANSLTNIGAFLLENKIGLEKSCLFLLKSIGLFNQIGMPEWIHPLNILRGMKQSFGIANFKSYIDNAYKQLDEELKPYIKLDEIFDLPIKVEKKPGRNELCPCGSGKKYKYCHGGR